MDFISISNRQLQKPDTIIRERSNSFWVWTNNILQCDGLAWFFKKKKLERTIIMKNIITSFETPSHPFFCSNHQFKSIFILNSAWNYPSSLLLKLLAQLQTVCWEKMSGFEWYYRILREQWYWVVGC